MSIMILHSSYVRVFRLRTTCVNDKFVLKTTLFATTFLGRSSHNLSHV